MEMMWMFGTYCLGTAVGIYFGYNKANTTAIEKTIDNLIENGYLRAKKLPNGDVDILKIGDE
jgi:hypothetical protein|tara:strand:- start:1432 stop:1617 length:186 start_codon:yes stop_codon:yes gene_type:complete